jgi:hypothetical protein
MVTFTNVWLLLLIHRRLLILSCLKFTLTKVRKENEGKEENMELMVQEEMMGEMVSPVGTGFLVFQQSPVY